MKKIGFIDIAGQGGAGDTFSLYIFRSQSGGYELDETIRYPDEGFDGIKAGDINEFYLSLPLSMLNFRHLSLPFSDRERLNKVIPFELENLTMASSGKVVFDAIVLGGSGGSFDVLVTYIEGDVLKSILARLSNLNIDPRIVTSIELSAAVGGKEGSIASRLSVPVRLNPDERIAAARQELGGHTVNLRTGAAAYTKDAERTSRALRVTTALAIGFALVINADLAFRIIKTKGEISSIRRDIRVIYSGIFPEEKKISDELYQMKSHMREIQEKGNALSGVQPLEFLLDLSQSQKAVQGVTFNEIGVERDAVTMKGEAVSIEDIGRMKTSVSQFLSDVSVTDIKPSVSGRQFFTVVAKGHKR